jgi:hypothetical protein
VQFLRKPSQQVRKLAAQVAGDAALFSAHLPQFVLADGHRLFEFGVRLAEALSSQHTVEMVIAAQLGAPPALHSQFISGYFAGLRPRAPDLWETSVDRLLHEEKSRAIGMAVLWAGGISERLVRMLLDSFQQGHVQAEAFSRLAWQAERDHIRRELVEECWPSW